VFPPFAGVVTGILSPMTKPPVDSWWLVTTVSVSVITAVLLLCDVKKLGVVMARCKVTPAPVFLTFLYAGSSYLAGVILATAVRAIFVIS